MADCDDITVVAAVCLQFIVIVSGSILLRRKRNCVGATDSIGSNRGYVRAMSVEFIVVEPAIPQNWPFLHAIN